MKLSNFGSSHVISFDLVNSMYKPEVPKKHHKFIFEYWVFSQKSCRVIFLTGPPLNSLSACR